jgi:hypothetical protein
MKGGSDPIQQKANTRAGTFKTFSTQVHQECFNVAPVYPGLGRGGKYRLKDFAMFVFHK